MSPSPPLRHALSILLFLACGFGLARPAVAQPPPKLFGRQLYCCTLTNYPIMYADPTHEPFGLNGLAIIYLEWLMREEEFECDVLEDVLNTTVGSGFSDFVEALDMCARNETVPASFGLSENVCQCDLGVGGWSFSSRRLGKVDFLPYFSSGELRVITHVRNTQSSFSGPFFVTSFTIPVWLSIGGLVVVWTFLKLLDTRMTGHGDDGVVTSMPSTRHWFLNTLIVLCGLFLVLAYEATMTANLVQEGLASEYGSIEDFRSCKILPTDVCLRTGTAQAVYWNTSIAAIYLQRGCEGYPKQVADEKTLDTMVANGSCKYGVVYSTTALATTTERYCQQLVIVGQPFNPGGVAFILPRGSPYTTKLTNATLRLRENGQLQSADDYFEQRTACEPINSTTLSFKKLQLFFLVSYVACIVFFLEMVLDPQKPRPPKTPRGETNGRNDNHNRNNNHIDDEDDEENGAGDAQAAEDTIEVDRRHRNRRVTFQEDDLQAEERT